MMERAESTAGFNNILGYETALLSIDSVALKQAQAQVEGTDVVLAVPALSAGVLVIAKNK